MENLALNTGEFPETWDLVEDYLFILENAIKSLSKRVAELQAALNRAQARISQLEKEKQR